MPSLFLVDAFANKPFTGNPAGVVPLTATPDDRWMQQVAGEMNQAETAFFWPEGDGYRLRWFTPTVEVDLCGHATLASAHVLWSELSNPTSTLKFQTRSGELVCHREGEFVVLDFPSEHPVEMPLSEELRTALPATPVWQGRNRMDHFVELSSLDLLLETAWSTYLPAIEALAMRGLIVTAAGGDGVDFTSRCFFPQSGVPEDSVTGSAHCALAPYWSSRLGKTELTGYQASPRGGFVHCTVAENRVLLKGSARTVVRGELVV